MTAATEARDFLALIYVNGTGSTFQRRMTSDLPALAKATARQARKDWGRLFSIPKGHVWTVSIFDVTAHPNVIWDATGVRDEATGHPIERHAIERPTA